VLNVENVQVSTRVNVGSLRAWCEALLCGCRLAASWDDGHLLLYMQVCVSDVQVSTTQRGKISVLGLTLDTLDKAVYTLVKSSFVTTNTAQILSSAQPSVISWVFSQTWDENWKSIIYTHRRSNLILTTWGSSCSSGTKRHRNSPSHSDRTWRLTEFSECLCGTTRLLKSRKYTGQMLPVLYSSVLQHNLKEQCI
jgi:hypothetical protein